MRLLSANRSMLMQQRGSSLAFSLVILTAITLGAVVAMQRSSVQLRMIGNLQQQQSIFNAAYSDIGNLFTALRNGNTANLMLGHIIAEENNWLANQDPNNPADKIAVNPYDKELFPDMLPAVPHNETVGGTSNSISVLQLPGATPNSLKMHAGSSAGTLVPYYFASSVNAWDTNQAVKSRQEAGFYYLGPAPQQ